MNGEVNGAMEESMDASSSSYPASPRSPQSPGSADKPLSDAAAHEDSENTDNSNGTDHSDTSQNADVSPNNDTSSRDDENSQTNDDEMDGNTATTVSTSVTVNSSIVASTLQSVESAETTEPKDCKTTEGNDKAITISSTALSQSPGDTPVNDVSTVSMDAPQEDVDMEETKNTNDEESDEVDSEEDSSSEQDGSDASDEGGTEDPVSINSDSEPEGVDEDSVKFNETPSNKEEVLVLDDDRLIENHNGEEKSDSKDSEVHEIISDNDDCMVTDEKSSTLESENKAEDVMSIARRRSSRVIKRKSYMEDEMETENGAGESDIEEISMEDPLNQNFRHRNKTIVVNDTKKLVEMANKQAKTNQSSSNQKKEPTVVIIDTNSILSGKGPLPLQHAKTNFPPMPPNSSMAAQNLYQSIAARGTTVTPVSAKMMAVAAAPPPAAPPVVPPAAPPAAPPPAAPQPVILPSLTDDMFVVEAPSFIVPYVYEKPSVKPFREFVDVLGKELEEQRAKDEAERLEREKERRERMRKEKLENAETEEADESGKTQEVEREQVKIENGEEELPEDGQKRKLEKGRKRRKDDDDASWDGESTSDSEDEGLSDEEHVKTVIIKEKEDDSLDGMKDPIAVEAASETKVTTGKSDSYFENSLGKFFIAIGVNLVQEYVQSDLLKQQKRKLQKENRSGSLNVKATESAISSLLKNLEFSKENNMPYKFEQKKCEFCSFKSESLLVMAHHMETPHMKNNVYKCNFCSFEIRSPHDILYHMEAEHNTRGRLERAPAYHQCANCPFEDNGKGKLARHLIACAKKFKPEVNLAPPVEWEPPAKIPKITRARNNVMSTYQAAFARAQPGPAAVRPGVAVGGAPVYRGRGRLPVAPLARTAPGAPHVRAGVVLRPTTPQVLLPSNYMMQAVGGPGKPNVIPPKMLHHQPSISITPLPRAPQPPAAANAPAPQGKGTFVICEICDGYIKDLEQLRNHMQWIHKVKIHPKMIYNRPPLNCQKCQFRFFTDQGLERHLLGSHGLVTSSMQEAANKGKDAGRCPVCGRVYQWKLLNHVARDHNLILKPAHLSYKCTVCTATFGMYKQFENHVYSAHSVVAKRVMDKNKTPAPQGKTNESLLKPLKINDEITIIPQPAKSNAVNRVNTAKKD